jgi:hypothetical protein
MSPKVVYEDMVKLLGEKKQLKDIIENMTKAFHDIQREYERALMYDRWSDPKGEIDRYTEWADHMNAKAKEL